MTPMSRDNMIKQVGGKYVVYDHKGKKRLSKPMSKAAAHKRLQQIEYFKHKGGK
jgi:hypothetical protein